MSSLARTGTVEDLTKIIPVDPTSWMAYNLPTLEPEYGHNFPLFRKSVIPTMQRDGRIRYALNLIKGPIQAYTVFVPEEDAENPELHESIREQGIQFAYSVKCKDEAAKQMILDTYNRFWLSGLQQAMLAYDWGFSCSQVMYKKMEDQSSSPGEGAGKLKIKYDGLKHFYPFDVTPLKYKTDFSFAGARVRGIVGHIHGKDIPVRKLFWHVHNKEHHDLWGQSRLEWAYVPWHELWTQYGARDIRRTWFFRNSYDGGTMRYPIGKTKLQDGSFIDHKELATQMMAQLRTGGFRILPNETLADGKTFKWDYEAPSGAVTPTGLLEYPEGLRYEILEAMGVPPEVVEGGDSGGHGAATGRKVPLMVYYATLFPLVNNVINDVRRFIIDILMLVNFGKVMDYDVVRIMPTKSMEQQQFKETTELKSAEVVAKGGKLPPKDPGKKPTKKSAKKTDPITKVNRGEGLPKV
jgi:hypothetical protein